MVLINLALTQLSAKSPWLKNAVATTKQTIIDFFMDGPFFSKKFDDLSKLSRQSLSKGLGD
jgi:hypothetical protein